ncbi:MAG TPA: DUF3224 domain-containing protein [Streptosporangiaceae bacterium]|nr:DUF3224 domain-containing protein [Streptosporangiaceae bacterium]
MAAQAKGTFTVLSWDENTYQDLDGGAKLTRARVTFGFSGDLEAEGGWEALMCYRDDGTAVFTGLQRTVGRLGGREGSFVLRADGAFENGEARTSWQVIPGSATGDLRGLAGAGSALSTGGSGGTFGLDYELA